MSPRPKGVPGLDHLVFPAELQRFVVSKAGIRQAFKAMEFLMLWGILADDLGREPTRHEFCEQWGEGDATYFRRLAQWRAIWPEDDSPQRVWEWHKSTRVVEEPTLGLA